MASDAQVKTRSAGGCDPSRQNVQKVALHIRQLVEGGEVAHPRVVPEVHIGAGRLQDLTAPLAIAVRNLSGMPNRLSHKRESSKRVRHARAAMCI